jgi:hypothetical protein
VFTYENYKQAVNTPYPREALNFYVASELVPLNKNGVGTIASSANALTVLGGFVSSETPNMPVFKKLKLLNFFNNSFFCCHLSRSPV